MEESKRQKEIQTLKNSDLIRDSRQLFIFKKTEKIVSAIFLITESFSHSVPQLSLQMREHAMNLLKRTLEVKSLVHFEVHEVETLIKDYLFLRSLFAVAHQTRLISDTNFSIVEFEMAGVLARLSSIIETPLSDAKSDVLDQNFFDIEDRADEEIFEEPEKDNKEEEQYVPEKTEDTRVMSDKGHVSFKGHVKDIQKGIEMSFKKLKEREAADNTIPGGEKTDRLAKITNLLDSKGQSSIKDIYDSFDGISEKTIQRDLQQLVQNGAVIKEGEKRWSTYKLAR